MPTNGILFSNETERITEMCWSKTGENVRIIALAYKGKFLYLSDRSDAVKRSDLYSN